MPTLLASLALLLMLLLRVEGNRFAAYDELAASQVLPRNMPKFWPEQLQPDAADTELVAGTSKMLNAFFGLAPTTVRPTEAALNPYQLPPMYYNDFYEDLLTSKRNDVHAAGCDCKVMVSCVGSGHTHTPLKHILHPLQNDLMDLGSGNFPRYLMSAVCEPKCTQGSNCKPLEYKVKVLTLGQEPTTQAGKAPGSSSSSSSSLTRLWLPDQLAALSPQSLQWHFRTVTVTAGCFCTN